LLLFFCLPKRKVTKEKGSTNRAGSLALEKAAPAILLPPHKSREPAALLLHPIRTRFVAG
jgi:hypothetical protein